MTYWHIWLSTLDQTTVFSHCGHANICTNLSVALSGPVLAQGTKMPWPNHQRCPTAPSWLMRFSVRRWAEKLSETLAAWGMGHCLTSRMTRWPSKWRDDIGSSSVTSWCEKPGIPRSWWTPWPMWDGHPRASCASNPTCSHFTWCPASSERGLRLLGRMMVGIRLFGCCLIRLSLPTFSGALLSGKT